MYMRQNPIRPAPPMLIYVNGGRRAIVPLPRSVPRGFGAPLPQQAQSIAGIAAAGASATALTLVALGAVGGPVGAAIAGIAALGVGIANLFGGCGQVCVQTANIDNQLGDILSQNVHQYVSSPVRYRSMQVAALNNFDTGWQSYVQAETPYGSQGQVSIQERQQGACKWKTSPGGWNPDGTYTWAGPSGSGSTCWNWFVGMRDPIANDPFVQPDPVPTSQAASAVVSALGLNPSTTVAGIPASDLLLPAALVLAGLIL